MKIRATLLSKGLLLSLSGILACGFAEGEEPLDGFLDAPLEELLSMEVTSVAKKSQPINEVAAAVFVITSEDIRRSGVTGIPEALRLAPGIQVARIDANKWAVTSRGFNNQFANKLLVMIDGRTVYAPSFSGVYWDAQDTLLEDIDRIEVIRGPGASVWGANAVNGVINIITRDASDTKGGFITASTGNQERILAGVRYGVSLDNGGAARFFVKYSDHDASYLPATGGDGGDDWNSLRAGFRADGWFSGEDRWTFQGDLYDASENQLLNKWVDPTDPENGIYAPFYLIPNTPDDIDSSGWNLLGRWEHEISEHAGTRLQIYFDHTERSELIIGQVHDTLDVDFQHQFQPWPGHDLIWGLGYRRIRDDFDNGFLGAMIPTSSTRDLYSAFIQDEIELVPQRWRLTLGSKFEHNDYTGFEVQPTARLLWTPDYSHTLWGAISRAVRTPARLERGSQMVSVIVPAMPPFLPQPRVLHSLGSGKFDSEKLIAYELGYRSQPRENLSLDLALYYNDYDDLQSFEAVRPADLLSDVTFDNRLTASSYGMELVLDWWPMDWWRLQSTYSYIHISISPAVGSRDPDKNNVLPEKSSPDHQFSIRSMMNLREDISLDLWLYYVDELERTAYSRLDSPVAGYTSFNARIAWRPLQRMELSLAGQNLFDSHHPEFIGENFLAVTEVERSWYAQFRWHF